MLDIALETDSEWDSSGTDWATLADRAVRAAFSETPHAPLAEGPRAVELSMVLTGDEDVRALNAQWRGKDKPTNVLSFPMVEAILDEPADGPPLLLGDIILAHGVCSREAADKGIATETHAQHLMIHGTLHLLGYDHHDDDEAHDMESREIRALAGLGLPDPYADRQEAC
ncbi:rRNA maturation RNase YbeY [Sphingomicrobium nitratireducens]|uniref:rRNA maturation RNase YbeY n=1 Tax=Sphingomicrobium nitratireducens TaxID=2964666 RepID=UPI0022401457|nr:rRNA maturation RNase YbeY [Sphingomicrobium nitratireducens]